MRMAWVVLWGWARNPHVAGAYGLTGTKKVNTQAFLSACPRIPGGMDCIEAGDIVMVVTEQRLMNDLGDIMEETK